MKHTILLLAGMVTQAFSALTMVEMVDPFTAGTPVISIRSGSAGSEQVDAGIALGGSRRVTVAVTSNPFFRDVRVGVIGSTGQMFVEAGPLAAATVSLVYDGGGAGLGGVDITVGGAANGLGMAFADSDPMLSMSLRLRDVGGNEALATVIHETAVEAGGVVFFKYADMTGASLLDFTRIDRLELLLDNGPSGDFTANHVALYHAPEPGAPMLAGLSALLFCTRRKRC